jgi:uncharacterized protein YndB with AHSA1/START domain
VKIVQWTLAAIGAVALAVVGIGFLLPSRFHVARSIEIAAPADRVYDNIAEPRRWTRWSEWNRRDPAMTIRYGGPPFGQGARWSWKSESEGSGKMVFTRVEPNRRIAYALEFPEYQMKSGGEFQLEEVAVGTRVTWTNEGDVGPNPLRHYLAWSMDSLVGPDFERGLANLKMLSEAP